MIDHRNYTFTSSLNSHVFLLSRRWPHHAGHSGYDRLGHYLGQPLTTKPVPSALLPDRMYHYIRRDMYGYDRTGIGLEILATKHMSTRRNCLYHVLYGENCYNYLGRLNGWRGHRIIASFHHPPGKFAEYVQRPEQLERLSGVIILGRNQYSSFEGILPRKRVFFVPHGVDTSFYTPPDDFSQREENLCLFVGAHLRDFGTLRSLLENARIVAPDLKFALVVRTQERERLIDIKGNHVFYSAIPEQDLRNLYRKASLLILPLKDAVANGSLLESMSCGLPIIVTDVGAGRDYTDEKFVEYVPPFDPDAMLRAIRLLMKDSKRRQRMSVHARKRALDFDWKVIARKMSDVYSLILNDADFSNSFSKN